MTFRLPLQVVSDCNYLGLKELTIDTERGIFYCNQTHQSIMVMFSENWDYLTISSGFPFTKQFKLDPSKQVRQQIAKAVVAFFDRLSEQELLNIERDS